MKAIPRMFIFHARWLWPQSAYGNGQKNDRASGDLDFSAVSFLALTRGRLNRISQSYFLI